jgi:hypothetical protein
MNSAFLICFLICLRILRLPGSSSVRTAVKPRRRHSSYDRLVHIIRLIVHWHHNEDQVGLKRLLDRHLHLQWRDRPAAITGDTITRLSHQHWSPGDDSLAVERQPPRLELACCGDDGRVRVGPAEAAACRNVLFRSYPTSWTIAAKARNARSRSRGSTRRSTSCINSARNNGMIPTALCSRTKADNLTCRPLVSLIDCYVVQLSQVFMLRVFPVGTNY